MKFKQTLSQTLAKQPYRPRVGHAVAIGQPQEAAERRAVHYLELRLLVAQVVVTLQQHLLEHGLSASPQGVKECSDEGLLEFLLHPHQTENVDVYGVDYPAADGKLYEGALMKVMANRYERNQRARKECVDTKGYRCLVCGIDFEVMYGRIGKGFIHVHHLTPISSIGREYELNVATDLVPVCPNCHYMLHRKEPPYSIEELKEMLHAAK